MGDADLVEQQPGPFRDSTTNAAPTRPPVSKANGGSATVTAELLELRPHDTFEEPRPSTFVRTDPTGSVVRGTWIATARGRHGQWTGEAFVGVSDPRDLTEPMRKVLGLDQL